MISVLQMVSELSDWWLVFERITRTKEQLSSQGYRHLSFLNVLYFEALNVLDAQKQLKFSDVLPHIRYDSGVNGI